MGTELWACGEVYATSGAARDCSPPRCSEPSLARSRAASIATRQAVDAVSWIAPRHCGDSPQRSRSQSVTTCSTSVSAGADCHVMPRAATPPEAMSPSTDASEALLGNQP